MEFPKRKPNRLQNYDYSQNGAYFITICTKNKQKILWNVGADNIRPKIPLLSKYGEIIDVAINNVSKKYPNVIVDKYVIMPNHIHLIICITHNEYGRIISAPTIPIIVGQMKRWVSKQIGLSLWQKSYHDRIIRDENEYQKIWEYIDINPQKWEQDCFYN